MKKLTATLTLLLLIAAIATAAPEYQSYLPIIFMRWPEKQPPTLEKPTPGPTPTATKPPIPIPEHFPHPTPAPEYGAHDKLVCYWGSFDAWMCCELEGNGELDCDPVDGPGCNPAIMTCGNCECVLWGTQPVTCYNWLCPIVECDDNGDECWDRNCEWEPAIDGWVNCER